MHNNEMKQEDDEILLLYMAEKEESPDNAKLAFEEFFLRYREFVARLCQRILVNIVDGNDSKDLYMEVFYRVNDKAGTFDSGNLIDRSEIRNKIELWISRIAKNMLIDLNRVEKKNREKLQEYKPIYREQKNDEPTKWIPLDEETSRAFEEEYEKLTTRDREILRLSGLYFDLEKGKSDMPSEVIEHISSEFGTTPDNIRKIRSRFINRLRNKVKQS